MLLLAGCIQQSDTSEETQIETIWENLSIVSEVEQSIVEANTDNVDHSEEVQSDPRITEIIKWTSLEHIYDDDQGERLLLEDACKLSNWNHKKFIVLKNHLRSIEDPEDALDGLTSFFLKEDDNLYYVYSEWAYREWTKFYVEKYSCLEKTAEVLSEFNYIVYGGADVLYKKGDDIYLNVRMADGAGYNWVVVLKDKKLYNINYEKYNGFKNCKIIWRDGYPKVDLECGLDEIRVHQVDLENYDIVPYQHPWADTSANLDEVADNKYAKNLQIFQEDKWLAMESSDESMMWLIKNAYIEDGQQYIEFDPVEQDLKCVSCTINIKEESLVFKVDPNALIETFYSNLWEDNFASTCDIENPCTSVNLFSELAHQKNLSKWFESDTVDYSIYIQDGIVIYLADVRSS